MGRERDRLCKPSDKAPRLNQRDGAGRGVLMAISDESKLLSPIDVRVKSGHVGVAGDAADERQARKPRVIVRQRNEAEVAVN